MRLGSEFLSDPAALPSEDWACTWYLAYSQPRQERLAAEQLANQGYVSYLPLCAPSRRRRPSAKPATAAVPAPAPELEPMFPRYVFFRRGSPQQGLSPARHTRGVSTLVSFGACPATVRAELVDAVREVERLRRASDADPTPPFRVGDRVRLCDEALQNLQCMVTAVSGQRVSLLLQILGRDKEVCVHHTAVELV